MTNAFEILAGFLDRTDPEVEGRALPEPPEPVKLKLRSFARGLLAPSEQAELVVQLNQNRHWMARLAEEVKALRQPRQPGKHEQ